MTVYVAMQYGWEHGELVGVGDSPETAMKLAADHAEADNIQFDLEWQQSGPGSWMRLCLEPVTYAIHAREVWTSV